MPWNGASPVAVTKRLMYALLVTDAQTSEASADLRGFSVLFVSGALAAAASLGGCATQSASVSLAPAVDTFSLTLPDEVSIVPYPRNARPVVVAKTGAQVRLKPASVALATQAETVEPIGYASPREAQPPVSAISEPTPLDALITRYSQIYEVPVELVRRVVKRESNFRAEARNGPYWGLMQILPATARGMGYQGPASGLLDAETNLKYAVKYLRGAWLISDGSHDRAVGFYSRGYYYDAKRRGMLDETGLGRDRRRMRGV